MIVQDAVVRRRHIHAISNPRIVPVLLENFPASRPRRCSIET